MNHNIAPNIEANRAAAVIEDTDLHEEAYAEGAFFAETDWQWVRKDRHAPASMAEHCAKAWAFIAGTVCREWSNEHARRSFFIGYEDRATELADTGEAGYEALAEAGNLADTEGWVVQCAPWGVRASRGEKALRSVRAAWAGAAAWQTRADTSGARGDVIRAEEALIRAEAAGDCGLDSRYVPGSVAHTENRRAGH